MIRETGKRHGDAGILHIVLTEVYRVNPFTHRRRIVKRVALCGFVAMISPGNNHSQDVGEDDIRCPDCRRLWVARGKYRGQKTPA